MKDVAGHGRTVLVVSHNMDAVMRLCGRAILFERGSVSKIGSAAEVVAGNYKEEKTQAAVVDLTNSQREGNLRGRVRLVSVELGTSASHVWKIPYGEPMGFIFTVEAFEPIFDFELGIGIFGSSGVEVASALSTHASKIDLNDAGIHKIYFGYPDLFLVSRQYKFGIGLRSELGDEDYIRDAITLDVVPTEISAVSKVDTFGGFIVPKVEIRKID